jgi:Uma2 family endonuclease
MAVDTMVTRRRFTRAEYYRMAEVGILREDDRVELIKGEIVEMSPIGRRHKAFVINLSQLLIVRLAGRVGARPMPQPSGRHPPASASNAGH